MVEYQKIETLFRFDPPTHTYKREYYNPIVGYLADLPWICSEKFDGTNVRVHWDGHRVEWAGRTDASELPKEADALLSATFGTPEAEVTFEQTFGEKDAILFMECYGGKVQGGIYGGKERLIGFDVMVGGIYLDKSQVGPIMSEFGVEAVEFFEVPNLRKAIEIVWDWAPASHVEDGKQTRIEGLVCVPLRRLYDHMGHRICVKIKRRDLNKTEGYGL